MTLTEQNVNIDIFKKVESINKKDNYPRNSNEFRLGSGILLLLEF